eukprot:6241841-Karenia_brevis.AAC.1
MELAKKVMDETVASSELFDINSESRHEEEGCTDISADGLDVDPLAGYAGYAATCEDKMRDDVGKAQ